MQLKHCALSQAASALQRTFSVAHAFDTNLNANTIYKANFMNVPISAVIFFFFLFCI